MMRKLEVDEVCNWVAANLRRVKTIRLLTNQDIARRMECPKTAVTILASDKWERCRTTYWLKLSVKFIVKVCNALEITPAELFSRPDDMSLLKQDGRKLAQETTRRKKKIKQTLEQQERQALLESLGLDE